jgi:quinol monooxygenase YgiN
VTFNAYEARDIPGRFYLYEIYSSAAAFETRLATDHAHKFMASIPVLSMGGPGNLVQLNEIQIPDKVVD